jgi:hypothetical protein
VIFDTATNLLGKPMAYRRAGLMGVYRRVDELGEDDLEGADIDLESRGRAEQN